MILMRELEQAKVLLEEKVANRTKELEKSNERLEQFAFIASHDLRAPLRMISSFLSLLERKITEKITEEEKELFQFVLNGAKDMNGLIGAILAYSRAQRSQPNPEVFDGTKAIESVNVAFATKLKASGGRVKVSDLPPLYGDRIMFRQIMQNLISNAIKFKGAEPPVIQVSGEQVQDRIIIRVSDNGIGIDPKYLDEIFSLFKKGHGNNFEGHGIGLSICQEFIESHQGKISVSSELGKGTTFTFDFPAPAAKK
ncbi:MAG: ATP-binding protein [Bacteroidota bacterium]